MHMQHTKSFVQRRLRSRCALLSIGLVLGCDAAATSPSDCALPPAAAPGSIDVVTGVPYYSPGGETQVLHLAWPKTGGPYPLVVFVHGGGWQEGSPDLHLPDAERLAGLGYVAASVGYRLAPAHRFPAAIEDVRCAIRFLRSRTDLPIDTQRVAAVGFSAGGHLVSLLGTAADEPAFDGSCPYLTSSPAVNAVVAVVGPQDLRRSEDYPPLTRLVIADFLGQWPESIPQTAASASPITHVRRGNANFLLVYAKRDTLVPAEQGRRMAAALSAAGVPDVQLIELDTGHEIPLFSQLPVACRALDFLHSNVGQ